MIFFTDNKKVFALFVLAALVTVVIFVQNFKIAPIYTVADDDSQKFWEDIVSQSAQTSESIKDSWELGQLQSKKLSEEMTREVERQELLEAAQDYVQDKQASSTASSTKSND